MRIIHLKRENIEKKLKEYRWKPDPIDTRIESTVKRIIREVREKGDYALLRYTKKFDRVELTPKPLGFQRMI